MPSVLVVSPAKGHKTLADFIKVAKAKPDAMSFASAGVGTGTHLSAMQFQNSTGIQAVHVPVKGGPEALTEVMSGRVDFFFAPVGVALPLVREGKLAALAVNGTERTSVLPDVPTTGEAGLVNAEYAIWLGLFLPAKTPHDIVEKLHRETRKALEAPKVKERLASLGVDPMVLSPAAFEARVVKEIAANAALVKTMGLKSP